MANPKPDLLSIFVYGIVWRRGASAQLELDLSLGPYREHVEQTLFDSVSPNLDVLAISSNLKIGDKEAYLSVAPYRQKLGGLNVWHLSVGGVEFFLKTDRRRFSDGLNPHLASRANPLWLPIMKRSGIEDARLYHDILENMS